MFVRRQSSKSCQMGNANCFKHNMPGGPHISWELQSLIISSSTDVHNSWECSEFLNFREVKSSPPKGDTEPVASSSFPRRRGPGPCGGAWLRGRQLSALWKGPPFPLPACKSRPRDIRQLLLIVTDSTSSLSFLEQLPPLSCEFLRSFLGHSNWTAFVYSVKWMLHTLPFIEHYHQSLRLEI